MFRPLPLFIATRYLRAKRKNRFASLVTGVSVAGIGLGVAVLIIVLSVMNGFEREISARILGMTADATVFGSPADLRNWPALAQQLERDPQVVAVRPFVRGSGMLSVRGKVRGIVVYGVPAEGEGAVSELEHYLRDVTLAALTRPERPAGIILGHTLADDLGVHPGDLVTLISPQWDNTQQLGLPAYERLASVGNFQAGMHEFDSAFGIMAMSEAARIFKLDGTVSGLRIKLKDSRLAPAVAAAIGQQLGPNFLVIDWTRYHRNFFLAIKSQKRIMFVILSIIVAVAAFNVVASMIMIVKEKQRDIAILRTLGLTPISVLCAFLLQGAIVTGLGVGLGVGLGLLGADYANDFMHLVEHIFGIQFIKPDVYYINYLPTEVRLNDALGVALATFTICVIATLYPAWRAAQIAPVDALRYE